MSALPGSYYWTTPIMARTESEHQSSLSHPLVPYRPTAARPLALGQPSTFNLRFLQARWSYAVEAQAAAEEAKAKVQHEAEEKAKAAAKEKEAKREAQDDATAKAKRRAEIEAAVAKAKTHSFYT